MATAQTQQPQPTQPQPEPTTQPPALPQRRPVARFHVYGTPISTNAMYRSRRAHVRAMSAYTELAGRQHGIYLSQEAVDWRNAVACEAMSYRIQARSWRLPLAISIVVSRQHKGDVDNYNKVTLDGLKDGLMIDDRHYNSVSISRADEAGRPHGVDITIYEADEAAQPAQ